MVHARAAIQGEGRVTIITPNVAPGPGSVAVRAGAAPGHVLLAVRDTGGGITPETQRRVFEPYFTARDPLKGAGLGLAIVHGLVEQQGGDIRCDSEVGRGTLFSVLLPRTDEALLDDGAPSVTPRSSRAVTGAP